MADHGKTEYSTAHGNDYDQHEGTYNDFVALTKWTVILVTIVLVGMWIFMA